MECLLPNVTPFLRPTSWPQYPHNKMSLTSSLPELSPSILKHSNQCFSTLRFVDFWELKHTGYYCLSQHHSFFSQTEQVFHHLIQHYKPIDELRNWRLILSFFNFSFSKYLKNTFVIFPQQMKCTYAFQNIFWICLWPRSSSVSFFLMKPFNSVFNSFYFFFNMIKAVESPINRFACFVSNENNSA